jgi:hypothetical protein
MKAILQEMNLRRIPFHSYYWRVNKFLKHLNDLNVFHIEFIRFCVGEKSSN